MSGFALEDFGSALRVRATQGEIARPDGIDRYDAGYNAGWDDALAQVEGEQARVGEKLAERLTSLEQGHEAAMAASLDALEPLLRDVFDRLLPRAAERAFVGVVMEELRDVANAGAGTMTLLVAPEEVAAVGRLIERSDLAGGRVEVAGEPALSLSQALIRWSGKERRIDFEAALGALDAALETFLATRERADADDADTATQTRPERTAAHG